jgi:NAD(P)-dependent dehydrogenase (short-subunit alcohol dehydrogenase family)
MRLSPLKNQVVVIMGASSGIGRATALLLAERGAAVVASARGADALESLVREIRGKGGRATAVVADVADADQVKRVAERAIAEHGRIDTWVNNAAVSMWAPAEATKPEEFKRILEVNLLGQVHGTLAALPHLRKSRGAALIHITSVEAKIALPFNSAYAASKHGLAGFIDALRLELMRDRAPVSVTQIMPATIDTPLFQNALTRLGVEPRGAPPVYEPEVVARAIAYAAEHPVRDLVVGGGGVGFLLAQRISPRLIDAMLAGKIGFESQMTEKRKSPNAPNNLYQSVNESRIHGDMHQEAKAHSLGTALQTNAVTRALTTMGDLGLAAVGLLANALYTLRYRKVISGVRQGARPAGMPAQVQAEIVTRRRPLNPGRPSPSCSRAAAARCTRRPAGASPSAGSPASSSSCWSEHSRATSASSPRRWASGWRSRSRRGRPSPWPWVRWPLSRWSGGGRSSRRRSWSPSRAG